MAPSWTTPPPHTPTRHPDDVEAAARVLMAKHASIEPRGFDSIRERQLLHKRIDALIDEYQLRTDLETVLGR